MTSYSGAIVVIVALMLFGVLMRTGGLASAGSKKHKENSNPAMSREKNFTFFTLLEREKKIEVKM